MKNTSGHLMLIFVMFGSKTPIPLKNEIQIP
jgi:hypothetical protein